MIRTDQHSRVLVNDRLVKIVRLSDGREIRQGKRTSHDCPLSWYERRIYVKNGAVKCVKEIMKRGLGLSKALDTLNAARN